MKVGIQQIYMGVLGEINSILILPNAYYHSIKGITVLYFFC